MLDIIALEDRTQTICADQTSEELAVTYTSQNGTGAASYQWYSNTTNTTGTTNPITGATASSFTPTTADLTPNTTTFFFVGITLDGCNEKASQVFTVELAPEISFTTQPETSQEVCEGGLATTPLSVTIQGAGTNGATYQWYQNSIGTTNGTVTEIISGATSNTYTPDFTGIAIDVQTNYYYYAIVTTTQGCTLTSAIATVVVSPALAATINPNTEQTVCENEEVILNVTVANGQGTASYQWYEAQDGAVANAINATFTAPTDIAGTKAYYAIVTYDQGPCTTITSETVSIVVTQTPIIADGAATSYTGTAFTYDPTTNTSNTIPTGTAYTWSVSNPGNITGASAVTTPENVISQTLTNTGTTDVTVNYTVTPTHNGCQGATFQVAVTVTAPMDVTATITNAACFEDGTFLGNGAIEISITGGVAPYTANWTADNGYTNNTADITGLQAGVYTLIVADAIGNEFSETYTITQPVLDIIALEDRTQTICADQTSEELAVTYTSQNGTGAASYQWYSNTTNTTGTTNPIAGATASSFTPATADLTPNATTFFFVGITLDGCNEKASQVFTVELAPEISFTTQPETSQEVCEGGLATTPLSVTIQGAGTNGATYQWYQNSIGTTNGTVTEIISGATSNTYTPDFTGIAIDVQTNYYYYAIATTTQGCTLTSAIATVVVSPALAATINPNTEQTVCENEEVILSVTVANGQGTATYQWYDAADPTTALASTIATFTVPTATAGTKDYYAIVTYDQGPCTTITSETVSIVVTQTPIIADGAVTSYTGTAFTYDPTTETSNTIPTGTTYTWTVNNPGNITGASAVTTPENVISQTLTNTGTTDVTVNYTVTPTLQWL